MAVRICDRGNSQGGFKCRLGVSEGHGKCVIPILYHAFILLNLVN